MLLAGGADREVTDAGGRSAALLATPHPAVLAVLGLAAVPDRQAEMSEPAESRMLELEKGYSSKANTLGRKIALLQQDVGAQQDGSKDQSGGSKPMKRPAPSLPPTPPKLPAVAAETAEISAVGPAGDRGGNGGADGGEEPDAWRGEELDFLQFEPERYDELLTATVARTIEQFRAANMLPASVECEVHPSAPAHFRQRVGFGVFCPEAAAEWRQSCPDDDGQTCRYVYWHGGRLV